MQPAAKEGDEVVGVDTHIVMVPSPGGPVPTPMRMTFKGTLTRELSADVLVCDKKAAVVGSKADNDPKHVPTGGPFQRTPSDEGTVVVGSDKVLINDKRAARNGDTVRTCHDPEDADNSVVVAGGSVFVG